MFIIGELEALNTMSKDIDGEFTQDCGTTVQKETEHNGLLPEMCWKQ